MSGMTKEDLKSALINHGVKLPPSSAKKEEYESLYREHIGEAVKDLGDFSDDEVSISPRKKVSQSSAKSTASSRTSKKGGKDNTTVTEENYLVVGELDIDALDDDELFTLLKEHGVDVGPIVASTRPFYKKKLAVVLRGDTSITNGSSNGGDAFSDTEPELEAEEEEQPTAAVISPSRTARTSTRSKTSSSSKVSKAAESSIVSPEPTGVRKRLNVQEEIANVIRQTPTPRRSIHSYKVTETTYQTTVKTRDGIETKDTTHTVERSESSGDAVDGGGGGSSRLLMVLAVVLVVVLLLAGLAYYRYPEATSADWLNSIKAQLPQAAEELPPPATAAPPKAAPTAAPPRAAQADPPSVADI